MQRIITATGKDFDIEWCGPSTIDGALRFEIVNRTMGEIVTVFMNPSETVSLTHVFDDKQTVFRNYTQFKGVDLKPGGSVVVALTEARA